MTNTIPDFELEICKSYFSDLIMTNCKCHEAYFGLCRLYSYESRYKEALKYINQAISIHPEPFYMMWSVVLGVKCSQAVKDTTALSKFFCCLSVKQNPQNLLFSRLEALPRSVETFWCYMELSRLGIGPQTAEYYATRIKDIDSYYGYLAWSELYLITYWEKGVGILKQIIKEYPYRPEAYAKLWNYYYYTIKDYEQAEDIASEAFLKVTDSDYNHYYILFCIACAKSYFKNGKTSSALELLQRKFIENSEYPIFLYQFGRLCCKSEDFSYNGSCIGALKECLSLCNNNKLGCIYYWLSKAYMQNRYHLEAYKYIIKGLEKLTPAHPNKKKQLSQWGNDMKIYISEIQKAYQLLSKDVSPKALVECLGVIKKIKNFHKLTSNILSAKLMWKIGKRQEAIEKFNFICNMSTVKISGYIELLKCLKEINDLPTLEKTAAQMMIKSKNPQVPTHVWVKSNILYAKALIANKKPAKAIIVLKCISKVFTPIPYANIEYTKALQKANSISDILSPNSDILQIYDTYKNSFNNPREVSFKIIDEKDAPVPEIQTDKKKTIEKTLSQGMQTYKKFSIDVSDNYHDQPDESVTLISDIQVGNNWEGISICSKPKFLYLIGKLSLKSNMFIEDGICAIKDYVELLKFMKNQQKKQIRLQKAEKIHSALITLTIN